MKDYKKILKGVINIIATTEKTDIGFAHICSYLSDNCDELFESEDERIRKAIIEHFEGSHSSMYPYKGFTKEQILAWLEKQYETFTKKDVDDAYLKGVCDAKRELEKQGKKKP